MILLQVLNTAIHYLLLKFLKKTQTLAEIELLIVSWLVSQVSIILLIDLEVWLRLQLNLPLVVFNYLIVLILGSVVVYYNRNDLKGYKWNFNIVGTGLTLILVLVSLYANVYSIRFFNAPLLHDPSNHGKIISSLLTDREKFDRSWYPQGFDYLASNYYLLLSNSGIKVDVAKVVLWQTNIATALFPLGVYILTGWLFGRFVGLVGFTLLFLNKIPFDLFYSSGKNSPLLFEAMMPGVLIAFLALLEIKRKWLVGIVVGLSLYALWLIHFPQLLIIGLPGWLLINSKVLDKKILFVVFITIVIMVGMWCFRNFEAYQLGNESIKIFSKNMEFELFGSYWKESLTNIYEMGKRYTEMHILYLAVAAIAVSIINFRRNWQVIMMFIYLLCIAFLSVVLINSKLFTLGVFLNEELYMVIPMVLIFCTLFFLSKVRFGSYETKVFFGLFLIGLIINRGKVIYWKYYENMVRDVVTVQDLETMKYFEDKEKVRVLVNNFDNGKVIAAIDAGMWIPTYYPNITVVPSDFNQSVDYLGNSIWKKLMAGDSEAITLLKTNDIDYVYIGANQVFGWSDKTILNENSYLKVVYGNASENNAGIYKVVQNEE